MALSRLTLGLLGALSLPGAAAAQGLPRSTPEAVGLSSTGLQQIQPWLQAQVDSGKYAGVVAVVARRGKLAWTGSAGWLDRERQTPIGEDALFEICSMTKPVTAAAVLQLYDRGALKLDEPVSRYIPAFGRVKVFAGGSATHPVLADPAQPIRISHLLTHTSGLSYGLFSNTPADTLYLGANLFSSHRTLAEFVDTLARLPLLFQPGTEWHYGMSLDVLGRVVEVVSGMPFDRYLSEQLFTPLGMTHSGFKVPPASGALATMYAPAPAGGLAPQTSALCYDPGAEAKLLAGGSGLLSTTGDYLRFLQMLLNGGTLNGHRVLKSETVRLMLSNELPASVMGGRMPDINLAQGGYGQGFGGAVLVDSAASGMPGSPGIYRWWGYASTFFWIDPKQELIGMLWAQLVPGNPVMPLGFQRLVYASLKRGV